MRFFLETSKLSVVMLFLETRSDVQTCFEGGKTKNKLLLEAVRYKWNGENRDE